jgi:hypothetical protein
MKENDNVKKVLELANRMNGFPVCNYWFVMLKTIIASSHQIFQKI